MSLSRQWRSLNKASQKLVRKRDAQKARTTRVRAAPRTDAAFLHSISSLRNELELDSYEALDGTLRDEDEEPSVHVVGYSLGGFTAQSVFMSWPFLITSSSTLLSGGALRELSPTAFAHPEEWQTVLHSLRYELDEEMMGGVHGHDSRHVDGMEEDLFLYLKRTFYEVFQQEYRGSFQSRLVAYRQRMLFVVGGNDPIVQTKSVLDSGPPGGINMLTIGGLGHFLDGRARDDEEREQRAFWLPEVARLIQRFGRNAEIKQVEERPYTWVNDDMQFVAYPPSQDQDDANRMQRLDTLERLAIGEEGALPAPIFERHLDDLLARQEDPSRAGLLLVLRNEIPAMLLDDEAVYEHAMLLNHDDISIARYIRGVRGRRDAAFAARDRVAVILPWNVDRVSDSMDIHRGYPSQAEAAKGALPRPKNNTARREPGWEAQSAVCREIAGARGGQDSVRIFDGGEKLKKADQVLAAQSGSKIAQVPSLPDCWIYLSREFLSLGDDDRITVATGLARLRDAIPAKCGSESAMDSYLRKEDLRLITVSRARYNPRFLGRLVADPKEAKRLLIHAAVCAVASKPLAASRLKHHGSSRRTSKKRSAGPRVNK